MAMSCVDGAGFLCSGSAIIRTENGIGLSSSGVQVLARSTTDLLVPNPNITSPTGFELATAGSAEVRIRKDIATGQLGLTALILRNLGLSWDGRSERPPIYETFSTTAGRVTADGSGRLNFNAALPPPADTAFYDFATRAENATQANYANNRYFPRADPPRCPADMTPCPTLETSGMRNVAGDWRTGGRVPDWADASRLHEDGDIHAGNGVPPGDLPGTGVPFPGSKGYRGFVNWSMQYSSVSFWTTQDTVLLEEWAHLGNEHNKQRRGVVAFGEVTPNAVVPASGAATYRGIAYGSYAAVRTGEPTTFYAQATVSVNFTTRQATVRIENAASHDAAAAPVPVNFTATLGMGAYGSNVANYMTGLLSAGGMEGGIGARWFGPLAAGAPAEVAGTFSLSGGGRAGIGGFIARQ